MHQCYSPDELSTCTETQTLSGVELILTLLHRERVSFRVKYCPYCGFTLPLPAKLRFFIPNFETLSPNQTFGLHWSKVRKVHDQQDLLLKAYLAHSVTPELLPCKIVLTRIAPRALDEEDNLPMSLKHVRDTIAGFLIPGLQPGRADGDKRIKWAYDQKKGKPREQSLQIEVYKDD